MQLKAKWGGWCMIPTITLPDMPHMHSRRCGSGMAHENPSCYVAGAGARDSDPRLSLNWQVESFHSWDPHQLIKEHCESPNRGTAISCCSMETPWNPWLQHSPKGWEPWFATTQRQRGISESKALMCLCSSDCEMIMASSLGGLSELFTLMGLQGWEQQTSDQHSASRSHWSQSNVFMNM